MRKLKHVEFARNIDSWLDDWLLKAERKPLVLRGARQVGKTNAVMRFAKRHGFSLAYLNLEKSENRRHFPEETSLFEFAQVMRDIFRVDIDLPNTLLFIDEIQEVPYLFKLLRFFYEDKQQLPVVAAGSLLEVKLRFEHISAPVGRVSYAYIYPLNFFEFLSALGEVNLLELLKKYDFKKPIVSAIHERLLSLFHEFVLVGGMPKAVAEYAKTKNMLNVNEVYSDLFSSFQDDVYKYTQHTEAEFVNYCLENAPRYAGGTIQFEKFGESQFRHREMKASFETLEAAMLLKMVKPTKSVNLPIFETYKKAPKLIFLDTGLMNYISEIQNSYFKITDLNHFYQGRIAEQIVGQELISEEIISQKKVYFWHGENNSSAELDFCVAHEGQIIGFEVKSGAAGHLRSLHEFLKRVKKTKALRIYSGQFRREVNFLSLPFYLLPRWKEAVGFFGN